MVQLRGWRLSSLLFWAAFGVPAESLAEHFDFLYIDANVGMSSGGHAALRIGDEVFHYQHDAGGFIALARDEWRRFRRVYNDLDNRNIHVARVKVAAGDLERVRDRFVQRHLIQNRHLEFLASLRRDVELLQQSAAGEALMIPGAGLFASGTASSRCLQSLVAAIESRYGQGFLDRKTAELEHLLEHQVYWRPGWDAVEVSDAHYPAYPKIFSEVYLDAITKLTAMRALSGGWDVTEDAMLDPRRYGIPDTHARLTLDEHLRLEELKRQLQESIVALVASPRGDSGFPILLAAARYLAVNNSLEQDRLLLVHPYFGLMPNLPFPDDAEQRRLLAAAALQFASSFKVMRSAFFRLEELDEVSLNLLENSAARYFETHRAARLRRPFGLPSNYELPRAPAPVPIDRKRVIGVTAARPVESAEADYRRFRTRLQSIYPYNLLAHNCATELVRTLNSAFADEHDAARALGAALDPDDPSVLIPFRLFDLIAERLHVAQRSVLPSFRNRMLARFSEQQDPLWIYLAESNTATSSLYRRRSGDTLFLMFTEEMPWLRPIFGTANLGYGLAQAGAGFVTAPFDRGERLAEGIRGALFSLPELAFFNIRKGSFAAAEGWWR